MDANQILVTDFAALFIVCCLYAVVLHHVRPWYRRKNRTWVMLVAGVVLVLIAIAALIPFGIVDLASFGIFVLAFCVAGFPVAIGEMIQEAREAGQDEARRERNHDDQGPRR